MYCNKCGSNMPNDAAFCSKCGQKSNPQNQSSSDEISIKEGSTEKSISELTTEKFNELAPKAKDFAAKAAEKAGAISKDFLHELKESGDSLKKSIDENKQQGGIKNGEALQKTATSFFNKLSDKQKTIIGSSIFLIAVVGFKLFTFSTPDTRCLTTGMSALGEGGIYPASSAKNIMPMQCQLIKQYMDHYKCSTNVFDFMESNPGKANKLVIGNPGTDYDIQNTKKAASVAIDACGF